MTSTGYSIPSNSPVLALNGDEDKLQVLIGAQEEGIIFYKEIEAQRQAVRYMPQAISEGLKSSSLNLKDFRGIAVVRGPGGFTGLRVVLSLALGLAQGAEIFWAGIDYLPLLAAGPEPAEGKEVWVLTYARKNLVYLQGFESLGLLPIINPQVIGLKMAREIILKRKKGLILLGSGLRRNLSLFKALPEGIQILPKEYDSALPEVFFKSSLKAKFSSTLVEPMYLRSSDAEGNLAKIAEGRGVEVEEFIAWSKIQKEENF